MPTDLTAEELAWVASVTDVFARSFATALEGRRDLIEGFLSGRYRLLVSVDEFVVAERREGHA